LFARKSATDVFKYISLLDPAVDHESPALDWEKYLETRDEQYIPLKEGCQAARFHLRPIEPEQEKYALSMPSDAAKFYEYVAFGLHAVENFTVDGQPVAVKRKTVNNLERADKKSLHQIFDADLFKELGGIVATISRLDPLRYLGSRPSRK